MQEYLYNLPYGSFLCSYISVENVLSILTKDNEVKIISVLFGYSVLILPEDPVGKRFKEECRGYSYITVRLTYHQLEELPELDELIEPHFLVRRLGVYYTAEGVQAKFIDSFLQYLQFLHLGSHRFEIEGLLFNMVAMPKPKLPTQN
jgi:hypothetical protein